MHVRIELAEEVARRGSAKVPSNVTYRVICFPVLGYAAHICFFLAVWYIVGSWVLLVHLPNMHIHLQLHACLPIRLFLLNLLGWMRRGLSGMHVQH